MTRRPQPRLSGSAGPSDSGRRMALAALALSLLVSFTGIFDHELIASDEIRVAEIGREVLVNRDAVVLTLGGEPFLEHPPLYYWLVSLAYRAFGVSDAVARLPSAIAGCSTLLLAFDLARRLAGARSGLLSVLVLGTMWGFFRHTHRCMVDSLLSLFVLLGYWAFALACYEQPQSARPRRLPRQALILLVYVAGALAFLTKGPVGPVLVGAPLAVAIVAGRRWGFLRTRVHIVGLLVLVTGCLAWPYLLYVHGGKELFDEYFLQNVVYRIHPDPERYTGGHQRPLWYYFGKLPRELGPWLVALPAAWYWVLRERLPERWNAAGIRFVASLFPLGFVLLSLPATKRDVYLMPLLAPLAVSLGIWAAGLFSQTRPAPITRITTAAFGVVSAIVSGLSALVLRALGRVSVGSLAARLARWSASAGSLARSSITGPWAVPLFAGSLFALALVVNLFFWNDLGKGRFLRPVVDAVIARNARPPRLAGFELHEEMRAAFPFYSALILRNLQSPEEVRQHLAEDPDALLLVGKDSRTPPEDIAAGLRELEVWDMAEGRYVLYDHDVAGAD